MSIPSRTLLLLASLLLSTSAALTAQHDDLDGAPALAPSPPTGPALPESSVPPLDSPHADIYRQTRTRIHTAPDDPEGGPYGIWAAGEHYKASFHGDFTFIPYLGGGYPHNQPLSWRTVASTVAGQPTAHLARAERWYDDYRYEYRYGDLVEAYDVRVDGIEQTFTLRTRPQVAGDWVVTGQLDTLLTSSPIVDQRTGIAFHDDDGNLILHYSAAVAFDANGHTVDVRTSYDGERIHLRVPGEWLATATFPVTIDPLMTRECTAFWSQANPPLLEGVVLDVDIGRDGVADQIMVAFVRLASGLDFDMWAYLFPNDDCTFANRNEVFVDVADSWGTVSPAIAFAGGEADSWFLGFVRTGLISGQNGARYHIRASGDLALDNAFSTISRPAGSTHGIVMDAGGVRSESSGTSVFVVYERQDPGAFTDVHGKRIELTGNVQGPESLIDTTPAGSGRTRVRPRVNQVADGPNDGWVVAWQEYWDASSSGSDDWDINLRRISGTGVPTGSTFAPLLSVENDTHKLTPQVEGSGGRYSLAFSVWEELPTLTKTTTVVGTDIFNERFDWPLGGTFAFGEMCEITAGLIDDQRWRINGGTHDTNTDSHWAWMFESTQSGLQYVSTTGYDAGRIERLVAYSPPGPANAAAGTVTFNDDLDRFELAYATNEGGVPCGTTNGTNHTVYCQVLTHLPEPTPTTFGVSCGPGIIASSERNLVGIDAYSLYLYNATPYTPVTLFVSAEQNQIPLDIIGMPGCALAFVVPIANAPAVTNTLGNAAFTTALPTCPSLVCGGFTWQWAYLAPGLNPLGVGLTHGLRTTFTCP